MRQSCRSSYLRADDGTRLAVDVWTSHSRAKRPAILVPCRYWRAGRGQQALDGELAGLLAEGYPVVMVDVRGTGASFGDWPHPHSRREIRDLATVTEWARTVAGGDGRVIGFGRSYSANDAELLIGLQPAGLAAVVGTSPDHDLYRDLVCPGGITGTWFGETWAELTESLDGLRTPTSDTVRAMLDVGVRPVGRWRGPRRLRQAREDHQPNGRASSFITTDLCIDDPLPGTSVSYAELSTRSVDAAAGLADVPMLVRASWYDAASAAGAMRRWHGRQHQPHVRISAASHGETFGCDPFVPVTQIAAADRLEGTLAFLDSTIHAGTPAQPTLATYTVGRQEWDVSRSVDLVTMHEWYLGAPHRLTMRRPGEAAADAYDVDWAATTGTNNRWHTQIGGQPVAYPAATSDTGRRLSYESEPLDRPLTLFGQGQVRLSLTTDRPDGAIFAYVEYVDAAGAPRMLTEGQLRLVHRAGTFRREDLAPMSPGRITQVEIPLLPISAVLPPGGTIRLSLAGHDADSFARYPETGTVRWHVVLGGDTPSSLRLPVTE